MKQIVIAILIATFSHSVSGADRYFFVQEDGKFSRCASAPVNNERDAKKLAESKSSARPCQAFEDDVDSGFYIASCGKPTDVNIVIAPTLRDCDRLRGEYEMVFGK